MLCSKARREVVANETGCGGRIELMGEPVPSGEMGESERAGEGVVGGAICIPLEGFRDGGFGVASAFSGDVTSG